MGMLAQATGNRQWMMFRHPSGKLYIGSLQFRFFYLPIKELN